MIGVAILNSSGTYVKDMADTTPPVIEMRGGDKLVLAAGDVLDDPGIIVYDDNSIPVVEIDSEVDITKEGDYRITYRAADESGNLTYATRGIKVIQPAGRIYLTFDDGPSEYTATLLDVLKRNGVKATFFVTGYGDDALIRREYDEGHVVALHTMSHNYSYVYANTDNYWADLTAVQDRVKRVTGVTTKLMRFPGGSSNLISTYYDDGARIMSRLVNEVTERGFVYFDWNVDSNDAGGATSADEVYNNIVSALKPGGASVVLQHDVKGFSVDAVERVIQYGLEHNYVFDKLRESSFSAHHGVNN